MSDSPRKYYRPHELAATLGVSARTVHRWIDRGLIKVVYAGWQVRIAGDEYDRILRHGIDCGKRRPVHNMTP